MADYYDTLRQLQDELQDQRKEMTEIERFIIWAKEEFRRIKESQNESIPS